MYSFKLVNKGPVKEFVSDAELQQYLNEWKKVLFLDNWIIQGVLKDRPIYVEDREVVGRNELDVDNGCSVITIVKADDDLKNRLVKYCAELILVHELLHCKYNWIEHSNKDITHVYFETKEHLLLEEMAKSLIMTKYNVDYGWFKNF